MSNPSGLRATFERRTFPWSFRPTHVEARIALLRRAFKGAAAPRRMLDLGCGAGENTLPVGHALGAGHVVGLDWARPPLALAHARGLPVVRAQLDRARLPFPDSCFDLVVLSEVIEHLVDTDAAADEAFRILKRHGVLLMTTPNLAAWFNRMLLGIGVQPVFSEVSGRKVLGRPGHDVVGHLRLFTRRALVAFLLEAGFTDVKLAGTTFHGVPRPLRGLDRLFARWPDAAANLLATASKP